MELQKWINTAYQEIVKVRPDANAAAVTVTLAVGVRQKLTDAGSINLPNATRLIDVVRNMADSSNKLPIILVDKEMMDQIFPAWINTTGSVNIAYWMYDLRLPKEFLVYPPATASAQIELLYSSVPTAHTLSDSDLNPAGINTEVIRLDDIYANAILDYVLYRSYLKDAESGSADRAAHHLQAFNASLSEKTSVDLAITELPPGKKGGA